MWARYSSHNPRCFTCRYMTNKYLTFTAWEAQICEKNNKYAPKGYCCETHGETEAQWREGKWLCSSPHGSQWQRQDRGPILPTGTTVPSTHPLPRRPPLTRKSFSATGCEEGGTNPTFCIFAQKCPRWTARNKNLQQIGSKGWGKGRMEEAWTIFGGCHGCKVILPDLALPAEFRRVSVWPAQTPRLKVQAGKEKPICPRRVCCTIYFNLHQAMHIKFR